MRIMPIMKDCSSNLTFNSENATYETLDLVLYGIYSVQGHDQIVGFVGGKGTTAETQRYSFIDKAVDDLAKGIELMHRLKAAPACAQGYLYLGDYIIQINTPVLIQTLATIRTKQVTSI